VIVDANEVPDGTTLSTDLCIVGGGPAGITLALALRDAPFDVLMLESGGLEYDPEVQDAASGEVAGLPYFSLATARLRYLGGSTNHWGGVCRPMTELDLAARPGVPLTGWPLAYAELDRFYPRAKELVGLGDGGWDLREWRRPDEDLLSDEQLGDRPADGAPTLRTRVVRQVEKQQRSFLRYTDDLRRQPNLTVQLHAAVTELVTDGDALIRRVEAATLTGSRFTVQPRVVVLATGGIDNARLLLASTDLDPAGLSNGNDLVGRTFLEHPRFEAARLVPLDPWRSLRLYGWHRRRGSSIRGYLALPDEVQQAEDLLDVQLRAQPQPAEAWQQATSAAVVRDADRLRDRVGGRSTGELHTSLLAITGDLLSWQRAAIPGAPLPVPQPVVLERLVRQRPAAALLPAVAGDVATAVYTDLTGRSPIDHIKLIARFDQEPNRRSRVRLSRERDRFGVPRAVLDWQLTTGDRERLWRSMELIGARLTRAGVGRVQLTFERDGTAWPDDLSGGWHHMGTTRMSASPRDGVVDPDLRSHEVPNLFVAGSSVFPTGGSGTPTLTLVALALRLAEQLRTELA
jgi:choline dehydrogenase-like flavoprotein